MSGKKILWIEDDSQNELSKLAMAVYYDADYDLQFAVTATEAVDKLRADEYAAVVVDIRIPAGDDPLWIDLFYKAGSDDKAARLGLRLLQHILGGNKKWAATLPPAARDPKLYGVLSMDSWEDLASELEALGITVDLYRSKKEDDTRVLLAIIEAILAQRNGGGDYP